LQFSDGQLQISDSKISIISIFFSFWPHFSVYQSSAVLFFLSFTSLVSYFSLVLCTRLNWQFSVRFQAHVKSSSSYGIVSYHIVFKSIKDFHCEFSLTDALGPYRDCTSRMRFSSSHSSNNWCWCWWWWPG